MPNLSGGGQNQVLWSPWERETSLRTPAAIPATGSLTFFTSQAVMRDGSGNIIQCDDTVKGEFVGFVERVINQIVASTDTIQQNGIQGDVVLDRIIQPHLFMAQMANVVAGQEGLKVYWQFNNQVQFTAGANGNYAGTVWQVFDATHAWILPPWLNRGIGPAGVSTSVIILAAGAGSFVLTKWDVCRSFWTGATGPQTITLPPVSQCSSGDRITFVYTGSTGQQVTLSSGAATINGAATFLLGTAQWSKATVETDGTQWVVL